MSAPLSDWFQKQGVQSGGWYGEAKAFAKRAQRASDLSAHAYRVLFCLRLHTVAYRSEKAVKQVGNHLVALCPHDIVKETGLERQKVRDALEEIEQAGYKISPNIRLAARLCGIEIPRGFVASAGYNSFLENAFLEYKEAVKVPSERLKRAFFVAPDAPRYKDERKSLKEGAERVDAEPTCQSTEVHSKIQPLSVGRHSSVGQPENPTDRPAPPTMTAVPDLTPDIQALIAVVEEVAVPAIGESPTRGQYLEIHGRLKGASPEHYKSRLEAKKRSGSLNSVAVLAYLADDCARTKDTWAPSVEAKSFGKKSFKESVMEEVSNRVARSGRI